jgi:hypothetical protein
MLVGVRLASWRHLQSSLERGRTVTKLLQVLIFIALLISGTAFVLGLAIEGPLLIFGTYFGWFAVTASLISYLLLVILLLVRGAIPVWGRVCLVNVGLSFMGIAAIVLDMEHGLALLATIILGVVAAIPISKTRFLETRQSVIVGVFLILGMALAPINAFWPFPLLALGLTFVVSQGISSISLLRA